VGEIVKSGVCAGTRVHTFLVLDLGLDIVDGVAALDLESDGLPRQRLHEDLHLGRLGYSSSPCACCGGFPSSV
jgi:hypothetical protein